MNPIFDMVWSFSKYFSAHFVRLNLSSAAVVSQDEEVFPFCQKDVTGRSRGSVSHLLERRHGMRKCFPSARKTSQGEEMFPICQKDVTGSGSVPICSKDVTGRPVQILTVYACLGQATFWKMYVSGWLEPVCDTRFGSNRTSSTFSLTGKRLNADRYIIFQPCAVSQLQGTLQIQCVHGFFSFVYSCNWVRTDVV